MLLLKIFLIILPVILYIIYGLRLRSQESNFITLLKRDGGGLYGTQPSRIIAIGRLWNAKEAKEFLAKVIESDKSKNLTAAAQKLLNTYKKSPSLPMTYLIFFGWIIYTLVIFIFMK